MSCETVLDDQVHHLLIGHATRGECANDEGFVDEECEPLNTLLHMHSLHTAEGMRSPVNESKSEFTRIYRAESDQVDDQYVATQGNGSRCSSESLHGVPAVYATGADSMQRRVPKSTGHAGKATTQPTSWTPSELTGRKETPISKGGVT